MNNRTHNGWTNYETWLTGLWLGKEEPTYNYWRQQAQQHAQAAPTCKQVADRIWKTEEAAKLNLADQLKQEIEDGTPLTKPDLYSDLLNAAFDEINWDEVAENLLEDILQPETGHEPKPVIHRYTRAQAIEDRVLVDVSETAREAGIQHPTAVSAAVWGRYIAVPKAVSWLDEHRRVRNIVTALRSTLMHEDGDPDVLFTVSAHNDHRGPRAVELKALTGPGDQGEPVITVMLPHED